MKLYKSKIRTHKNDGINQISVDLSYHLHMYISRKMRNLINIRSLITITLKDES